MTFIDNSAKTNWKFIGIVVILAVWIAGILLLFVIPKRDIQPTSDISKEVAEESATSLVDVEAQFAQNKANLQTSEAVVGEDATSGFYYTIYKDKEEVQVVREAWNGGAFSNPTIAYYFFINEQLILLKTLEGEREDIQKIIEGSDENTAIIGRLTFE